MAKINSILGKMKGKIGNVVVSNTGGAVIAREYNPQVANPNTDAQMDTRAKFKLASQLGAIMAPVIAIRKNGLVSARNQFTSINFPAISYNDGTAEIDLNVVQLTKSSKTFPGFAADRADGAAIACTLKEDAAASLSRVVYIAYQKNTDGSLVLLDSKVISEAGVNGDFPGSLKYTDKSVVCYAYGIKDNTNGITAKFGNINAPSAEDVAKLLVSSSENMQAVNLTQTAGLTMEVGETEGESGDAQLRVRVAISGNGSAIGGGRFYAGQSCTLSATSDAGSEFIGWFLNDPDGELLSSDAQYTFVVTRKVTICALFKPAYQISAVADPANAGQITGTGEYVEDAECTLRCIAEDGYNFEGWYENDVKVSSSYTYTFQVEANRNLVAKLVEVVTYDISASVDPAGSGDITGAGRIEEGTQCTLICTPASGYKFNGWYENDVLVSEDAEYEFTVTGDRSLVAKLEAVQMFTISSNISGSGVVEGVGSYEKGSIVHLRAIPADGYQFQQMRVISNGQTTYIYEPETDIEVNSDIEVVAQLPTNVAVGTKTFVKNITGMGSYNVGDEVTVSCSKEYSRGSFYGWYRFIPGQYAPGELLSTDLVYKFTYQEPVLLYPRASQG